ncbi:hypothetical protein US8_00711 [Bacillus altitudinis]|nr:hypothetical protein US8_00711 [Bacillus altitudinis]
MKQPVVETLSVTGCFISPFFRDQRKSFVLSEGIYFPAIKRT